MELLASLYRPIIINGIGYGFCFIDEEIDSQSAWLIDMRLAKSCSIHVSKFFIFFLLVQDSPTL